jgi:CheY-like chemotaxis protein
LPIVALVDDSADNIEIFSMVLETRLERECVRAYSSGQSFIDEFQANVFDVVLLDISLPDLDGYTILRTVRRIDPGLPVIAFTAHAYDHDRQRALDAGFSAVIVKPVLDSEAFCRTILEYAGRRLRR